MMRPIATVIAGAASALLSRSADAGNPNYKWCFSPTYPNWGTFSEPVIDGAVDNVFEWSKAFSYTFNNGIVLNGINQPDAIIYALHRATPIDHLMLAFQVKNDDTLDPEDTILMTFDYGAAALPRFGMITLQPLTAAGDGTSSTADPGFAAYRTSTTGAAESWSGPATAPSWIRWVSVSTRGANCGTIGQGGCSWNVELKIDLGGAGAPLRPQNVYFNVIRAQTSGGVSTQFDPVVQFPWPNDQFVTIDVTNTPAPAQWGTALVDTPSICGGVSVAGATIAAAPLNAQGEIQPGVPTTLSAKVRNNSISGADGSQKIARGVRATFQFTKFGSAGAPVFTTVDTTPPTDLAASSDTTMAINWPSPPTVPVGDDGHRCFLVTLDSAVNDTTFVNRGDFRNMTIHHASAYTGFPVINVKGQPPPPAGQTTQKVRLSAQTSIQFAFGDGTLAAIPAGTLTAQFNWLFHPVLDTGKFLTLRNKKFRIWNPMPSFGFSIQHALTIDAQNAFERRHAQLLKSREISKASMRSAVLAPDDRVAAIGGLNAQLALETDRPSSDGWSAKLDGVAPVPGTGGRVFDIDVPVNGERRIPATVAFRQIVCGEGCCACQRSGTSNTTPAKVTSLGMIVVAGMFARRRRRPR
jgi:hypothetical protein